MKKFVFVFAVTVICWTPAISAPAEPSPKCSTEKPVSFRAIPMGAVPAKRAGRADHFSLFDEQVGPPFAAPDLENAPFLFSNEQDFDPGALINVKPGQAGLYKYSPAGGLEMVEGETLLTGEGSVLQAVLAAPKWLRFKLADTLGRTETETAERVAEKILEVAESEEATQILDEVCFAVAFFPPQELEGNDETGRLPVNIDAIIAHAKSVYERDEEIDFARLVELGSDDNPQTTVEYNLTSDQKVTVDPWIYYMYVFQPKLDGEVVSFVDPADGSTAEPPAGLLWRDHFWSAEPWEVGYAPHFLVQQPNAIEDDDLQSGELKCRGVIGDFEIDPLVALVDENEDACLAEISLGAGTIVVSTIPVESGESEAQGRLLANLATYGNGDVEMYSWRKVGVVGLSESPETETVLDSLENNGFGNVDLIDPDGLAEADISGYYKIIFAGNQPLSVYQDLSDRKEAWQEWVSAGKVLELHLYGESISEKLVGLPGGFSIDGSSEAQLDGLVFSGQPVLRDIVDGAKRLLDDYSPLVLPGERFFDDEMSLANRITYWVGQNMKRNIAEATESGRSIERAVQPVRIARNHYGNCGENQDMIGAATRSLLIPVVNVANHTEDHVWNELYTPDGWLPIQVDWSDSPAHIADPSICYEKLYGGGKDIAIVVGYRADGEPVNRTASYSETIQLNISLDDAEGNPVDGAMIIVATEAWGSETDLTIAIAVTTDEQGKASVELGDSNNYYLQVQSPLGVYPGEGGVVQVIKAEEATPGSSFDWSWTAEEASFPNVPRITVAESEGKANASLEISHCPVLRWDNISAGGEVSKVSTGGGTFYFLSPQSMAYREAGMDFEAFYAVEVEDCDSQTIEAPVDLEDEWYLLFVPTPSYSTDNVVSVSLTDGIADDDSESPADEEKRDDDNDDGDEGCSCHSAASSGRPWLLWLFFALLAGTLLKR